MVKDTKGTKGRSEVKKPQVKRKVKTSCGCGCIPSMKTK